MKKISIIQSNYLPWKGYFDIINSSHEFIIYDKVQFTKNDWRNRNKIIMNGLPKWITIPVKHDFGQMIYDVQVASEDWRIKHWDLIFQSYRNAKCFKDIAKWLEQIYLDCDSRKLSSINKQFIIGICDYLDVPTVILDGKDFDFKSKCRTQRLIDICLAREADIYVTGPSAMFYLDLDLFKKHDIRIEVYNYDNYKEYEQSGEYFDNFVSIIDLLFNEGKRSKFFMKSF